MRDKTQPAASGKLSRAERRATYSPRTLKLRRALFTLAIAFWVLGVPLVISTTFASFSSYFMCPPGTCSASPLLSALSIAVVIFFPGRAIAVLILGIFLRRVGSHEPGTRIATLAIVSACLQLAAFAAFAALVAFPELQMYI